MHTRVFECQEVSAPATPQGAMRQACADDVAVLVRWWGEFLYDMDAQGGRTPDPEFLHPDETELADRIEHMTEKVRQGQIWVHDVDGHLVHMTGHTPATSNVCRIGSVYTPTEYRGHGYAGYVVASVTQHLLDQRYRVTLYTDQANPVSNKVYERIGFQAVADDGNVVAV